MVRSILILNLVVLSCTLFAQEEIGGVVNKYYQVTNIANGSNTVTCANETAIDLDSLKPGDKVLLVQMTGGLMEIIDGEGAIDDVYGTGLYELLAVKNVNSASKTVEFTATLKNIYQVGEKIQLVKIYESENAIVKTELRAESWDPTTGKGGVLALVVFKKLELEANINVSAMGFKGAQPEPNYSGGCKTSALSYYIDTDLNVAGKKGEGISSVTFPYTKGKGHNLTGGGGGPGKFAGGGGGANYNSSDKEKGAGGYQDNSCASNINAEGGISFGKSSINNFYTDNRISFGGGGGSSTEDATYQATAGGHGGGLVIILADTLDAKGNSILANGGSVIDTAEAGAGGAGAGGTILVDVASLTSFLMVNMSGGNGGNTFNCTGPGGGGGGGLFYYGGKSLSNFITVDSVGGTGGVSKLASCSLFGQSGVDGGTLYNLKLVLNGFVFNSIEGTDTICAGSTPNSITGTTARGNSGPFSYDWKYSTDSITWYDATDIGSGDSLSFNPDPLTQTTFISRWVTNNDNEVDTALPIKIFVYPAITNNNLLVKDTLCEGMEPFGALQGMAVGGGNSEYTYLWESSVDHSNWTERSTSDSFIESVLDVTTYYRRTVSSAKVVSSATALCVDASPVDTITVLEHISNNIFTPADTSICEGLDAGTVQATSPENGDGIYRYAWLESSNGTAFSTIGGATLPTYTPGNLGSDMYYKRIVRSGSDDVCVDTTTIPKNITVYKLIKNNHISTDSARWCAGDMANTINGELPLDGGNSYTYQWRFNNGSGWQDSPGQTQQDLIFSGIIEQTTSFERIVYGTDSACIHTSNVQELVVVPYIVNALISPDESICENAQAAPFIETAASGGLGGFTYLWQENSGTGDWSAATGSNTSAAYTPPVLTQTTMYRRAATSNICTHISDSIEISVFPIIENNTVESGSIQYTCKNTPKLLTGTTPSGGDPVSGLTYLWQESVNNSNWSDIGASDAKDYETVALIDTNYFRRVITSGPLDQCTDTSSSVLIRINQLPTGNIVSKNDTICNDDSITVDYNFTGNAPWGFKLGPEGTILEAYTVSQASGSVYLTLTSTTSVKLLSLEDDSTCLADLSTATEVVEAKVYDYPIANAGLDADTCGLQYVLKASLTGEKGVWSTREDGSFDDETNPNSLVTMDSYGEKKLFVWTVSNWNCPVDAEVKVNFWEQPEATFAGEDAVLANKLFYDLQADAPTAGEGVWQFIIGDGFFNDSTNSNTRVDFYDRITHVLEWSVKNGSCLIMSDSLRITVEDIKAYTGFTPNGDGFNDEYLIDLDGETDTEFIVFSRFGLEVYSVESSKGDLELRWDGKNNNGEDLPSGTYFYIIKRGEGLTSPQGYIELRR